MSAFPAALPLAMAHTTPATGLGERRCIEYAGNRLLVILATIYCRAVALDARQARSGLA